MTVLFADMVTIWENTDGCEYQYCCAAALYLLLMLSHAYNIITDIVIGVTVHDREFVDVLNATDKRLLSVLITTVQHPGVAPYYSQM